MLSEFVRFDEICEAVIRVVKHCLRVLGDQFEPYLQDFIKKSLVCYQQNAIGCFVYSVEFLAIEFNRLEQYHPLFKEAFEFTCK